MTESRMWLSWTQMLFLLLIVTIVLILFIFFLPPTADWYNTFARVADRPLIPYTIPSFLNPPWLALFLAPFGLLSDRVSQAINATLHIVFLIVIVQKYKSNRTAYFLTLTSYPFMGLLTNGAVEWISMLGFLIPGPWGAFLVAAKPQTGILAALIWFKKSTSKKRYIMILSVLLIFSFLIWGFWPAVMMQNAVHLQMSGMQNWNSSFWPWGIPVGVLLLYQAWKKFDDLLAVAATFFLVPYFALHSLTIGFALLAARNTRLGILVWILLWMHPFLKAA